MSDYKLSPDKPIDVAEILKRSPAPRTLFREHRPAARACYHDRNRIRPL